MMTSVLRDSLGGNCKTIMIATINPEAAHSDESLSTCRFAQRVSLIKNKASVNEDLDPLQLIRRLKAELLNLREEISFLKGENSDEEQILTPSETEELMNNVRFYMNDPDQRAILNIGSYSLTHLLTHSLTHSLTHLLTQNRKVNLNQDKRRICYDEKCILGV